MEEGNHSREEGGREGGVEGGREGGRTVWRKEVTPSRLYSSVQDAFIKGEGLRGIMGGASIGTTL